jgi:cellulose synthase/poly-beta-1,6-N-acetylglucosamine synthase-like glycosyltransferase
MSVLSGVVIGVLALIYAWVLYNLPTLAAGLSFSLKRGVVKDAIGKDSLEGLPIESLPSFSLIVPAKDEERVVGRLLEALLRLDYPLEKKEIIVVEDGSKDETARVCAEYADRYPRVVRFYHRSSSNGKPNALNFAVERARGDIIGIFDADNVPEKDVLMKAASYFYGGSLVALQGKAYSLNSGQNLITRMVSYEEAAWYNAYIMGKEALGLFVPFTGTCMFIRRRVFEEVGGWDEGSVAEDVEFAARLLKHGRTVKFAPDVASWQESPSKLRQLMKQRVRWFRGYMDTALKYGFSFLKPRRRWIDAEATLAAPFIMTLCFGSYMLGLYSFFFPIHLSGLVSTTLSYSAVAFTLGTLTLLGLALAFMKPRRLSNLVWIPFIYGYWFLQTVMASTALLEIVLRRPKVWVKTEKTGVVTDGRWRRKLHAHT